MLKQRIESHIILTLILAVIIGLPSLSFADGEMDGADIVRGKIGIEIINKGKSTPARKRSRITSQDRLKIYTVPEFKSYTYVISSDKKNATLLTSPQNGNAKVKEGLNIYPGPNQFYQFDENSDVELITVICSPTELKDVQELFASRTVSHENWEALEKKLIGKSRILISKDVDKQTQFILSFAPQGLGGLRSSKSFVDRIPVRKGSSLLIKKYEFRVFKPKK